MVFNMKSLRKNLQFSRSFSSSSRKSRIGNNTTTDTTTTASASASASEPVVSKVPKTSSTADASETTVASSSIAFTLSSDHDHVEEEEETTTEKQNQQESTTTEQQESSDDISDDDDDDQVERTRIEIVKTFMTNFNHRKWEQLNTMITNDFRYEFYDINQELVMELDITNNKWEVADSTFQSFPDFHFAVSNIAPTRRKKEEDDDTAPTMIITARLVASGTHTGRPFSFGPFEPIPASGKKVVNDPEEFHYYFRGGKLYKIQVYPQGEMTGPAGIYTQLGGFPLL